MISTITRDFHESEHDFLFSILRIMREKAETRSQDELILIERAMYELEQPKQKIITLTIPTVLFFEQLFENGVQNFKGTCVYEQRVGI